MHTALLLLPRELQNSVFNAHIRSSESTKTDISAYPVNEKHEQISSKNNNFSAYKTNLFNQHPMMSILIHLKLVFRFTGNQNI